MEMENKIAGVRDIEIEILNAFDEICKKNHLKYSLAFGTLLGAIRHGGFIPWDDDIDVIMPRKDYETLYTIWSEVAPKEYVIQNYYTDDDTFNNFTKIRKNQTTFLQFEVEKERKYHKGIFIDIFPADRVPKNKICRMIQYGACAINLLYSRGHASGVKGIVGVVEKILLCGNKKKYRNRLIFSEKIIKNWNNKDNKYVIASTLAESKIYYPADLFENMSTIKFEGRTYCSVNDPDKILRILYGDYMKLPPVSERVWKHHPLIIDFKYNYEELVKSNE